MQKKISIGIIGDFDNAYIPHIKTEKAITYASYMLNIATEFNWLPTEQLEEEANNQEIAHYDALWCAPGSPYKSLEGAVNAIQLARESRIPLLGTCGGFQHIVIEYARNVLGFEDAQHAEYDPYASHLFISKLSCSLAGEKMKVDIDKNSRVYDFYQTESVEEEYYCNFGLEPRYQDVLDRAGLRIVGVDQDTEARILEIPDHPYYVATLFVPQLKSTHEKPHPLIINFIRNSLDNT